jgi:hypothetical protein
MAKKIKDVKQPQFVLTVRIDEDVDQAIEEIKENKGGTKAKIIKDYLQMSKYVIIDKNSIKSLNNNDLILLKRNFFKVVLDKLDEVKQIELGSELGRFVNDIARGQKQLDNLEYKLNLCEHLGFFNKYIDKENYINFSMKFGPKKFVEAFVWELITKGDDGDFDTSWIDSEMGKSKSIRSAYEKKIQPIQRDSSYYSFEMAKIK